MANNILPGEIKFVELEDELASLDLKAICAFVAFGFFLDKDTFWLNKKISLTKDSGSLGMLGKQEAFDWHYTPANIKLHQAVDEFTHIFETSINKATNGKVILPLSGGLDSRTIAAALTGVSNVNAFSYKFHNGLDEIKYGRKIAEVLNFPFKEYTIPQGYLWNCIDRIAEINQCYAEFTHPRQMYIIDEFSKMGDIIFGGHGGDLLFDAMTDNSSLSFEEQVDFILKKMIKKGGAELSEKLWQAFGLEGNFQNYVSERISEMLLTINISHASARLRAFKSKYYLPRLTMVNLGIYKSQKPMHLPYFTDEMFRFICTVPEDLLAGRKIQIEYLKLKSPPLAKIVWQKTRPFNLYNYKMNRFPWNFPHKIINNLDRYFNAMQGHGLVQRNWELQFLGKDNDEKLRDHLFNNPYLNNFIPQPVVKEIYNKFIKTDSLTYSHPVSMLLTLSLFAKKYLH